jgi:hypothetical protein
MANRANISQILRSRIEPEPSVFSSHRAQDPYFLLAALQTIFYLCIPKKDLAKPQLNIS